MEPAKDMQELQVLLNGLREKGMLLLAYLYGSCAEGTAHIRSDIDLALYLNTSDEQEKSKIIDSILMTSDRQINILLLDDEDESPFVVQKALKGKPLVLPDLEALYRVAHRVLHETEGIRFRKALSSDAHGR
jgi:uncharacterized protein